MEPPIFVRSLSTQERQSLKAGLRSSDGFTLRRCQILLASAQGERASDIARHLGCASQTVRNAIHAFNRQGLLCLSKGSSRPKTVHPTLASDKEESLRALLHQSPRAFGQDRSTWTLPLLAEVCHLTGLTNRPLSREAIRLSLKRMGINWKRAKHSISSPDPQYGLKKSKGIG